MGGVVGLPFPLLKIESETSGVAEAHGQVAESPKTDQTWEVISVLGSLLLIPPHIRWLYSLSSGTWEPELEAAAVLQVPQYIPLTLTYSLFLEIIVGGRIQAQYGQEAAVRGYYDGREPGHIVASQYYSSTILFSQDFFNPIVVLQHQTIQVRLRAELVKDYDQTTLPRPISWIYEKGNPEKEKEETSYVQIEPIEVPRLQVQVSQDSNINIRERSTNEPKETE